MRMINVDLTMIGSLDEKEIISDYFHASNFLLAHLKKIETQMKAKAAEREMYWGRAHRR